MTTEAWIASVLVVLFGWISLQLAVMYFADVAPGAVTLFPNEGFISRLPANTGILDIGNSWIMVAPDAPELGKKLYAAGAWIVLPAGLPGCLPLP